MNIESKQISIKRDNPYNTILTNQRGDTFHFNPHKHEGLADFLHHSDTRPAPISDKEIVKESHEVARRTLASKESVLATLKGLTLIEVVKFGRLAWINGAKWALSQGNTTLIKKLWTLWESLAEAGELSAGKDFIENYNRLKKEV